MNCMVPAQRQGEMRSERSSDGMWQIRQMGMEAVEAEAASDGSDCEWRSGGSSGGGDGASATMASGRLPRASSDQLRTLPGQGPHISWSSLADDS